MLLHILALVRSCKMKNITTYEITEQGEVLVYVLIDHGNEQFTTILKADYDKQQAEQSTPSVIDEAEAK